MICPVCGNQLPDGSVACNVCGNTFQQAQPQAPQYNPQPQAPQFNPQDAQPQAPQFNPQDAQPQFNPQASQPQFNPQAAQPQQQFNPQASQPQQFGQPTAPKAPAAGTGAVFDPSVLVQNIKNPINLLPVIGSGLVFLSAFLPWMKMSVLGIKESASLWEVGGFYILMALFFLIGSLCIVALKFRVINIPAIEELKKKPYSYLYIPGIMLLFFLYATIDIGSAAGEYSGLAKVSYGFGWILALLGLAAITVEAVMKLVKKEDYY